MCNERQTIFGLLIPPVTRFVPKEVLKLYLHIVLTMMSSNLLLLKLNMKRDSGYKAEISTSMIICDKITSSRQGEVHPFFTYFDNR